MTVEDVGSVDGLKDQVEGRIYTVTGSRTFLGDNLLQARKFFGLLKGAKYWINEK